MDLSLVIGVVAIAAIVIIWTIIQIAESGLRKQKQTLQATAAGSLSEMFIFVDATRLFYMNVLAFVFVPTALYVMTENPVIALGAAVVIVIGPRFLVAFIKKRREKKFEAQLPDALLMVAGTLRAGASLNVALESMVSESQPPVSQEFELMLREQRLGVDLDTALQNMERRMPLQDFIMVVAGMRISREVGGNLADTLEGIADTLRRKLTMEGKIQALTSQGRMQGIVMTCLPLFLMFILKYMEPEAMEPLFTTWYGWITLLVIIVMEFVGYFFIRKIVNIDV
ncbi:type II secretion system F family protein [Variovorax sp. VNK109]|uniref:type II secretion system F family protein n=1 Tax=Variovorax sp. VNK109 TaxID=3400919 RepID=UPI003C0B96CE